MADNWEEEDWENAEIKPIVPVKPVVKGKFDDEEEEEEDSPAKKHVVPESQPKKEKKKIGSGKERVGVQEEPLADPVAEKLRQQRLVEQSDLMAAKELFGTNSSNPLDNFIAKTKEDFEKLGDMVAATYVAPHHKTPQGSSHYKPLLKAFLKTAMADSTAAEVRDIAHYLTNLQADKLKDEAAAKALAAQQQKKAVTKKGTLNVGKSGGSAGLDDYIYEDAGAGDDYDFM